jgi:hypothetical protein
MTANELIEQTRPVLEELTFRLHGAHGSLVTAIRPMLEAHKDEMEDGDGTFISILGTALFLMHPDWNPDDVMDVIREAAKR